jgi:D-amino-acid dehydrogenase
MRITIIGAGFIGLATAHALLDQGHTVEIVDRDGIAAGASRGNAGWIAHTDIMPLASPKMWRNLPRWLRDPLGPLSIRPAYALTLLPWLRRFLLSSRPAALARSIEAIAALNMQALPAWERRLASLRLGGHLRRRGAVSVWIDAGDFAAFAGLATRQRALGIAVNILNAAELRALEPALGPAVVGGAFYPDVCSVSDPLWLCQALGEAAVARGAAVRRANVAAVAADATLTLADGQTVAADRVVIAAGAWCKPLAAQLGEVVPLDTERGYNITLAPGALRLRRPVMFEGQGFVFTPLDSGDRLGGSVEFAGLQAPPNMARVDAMIGRLHRFMPTLPPMEGPRWMGFRPSMPDSLPVIGHAAHAPAVFYAFGHGHYGLTQAAVTAEIIAALVAEQAPPINPVPYASTRF